MTTFNAKQLWTQVAALREALESGETALLSPEEHSTLQATVGLLRYLDAEGCFEVTEKLQALARVSELTQDDAPAPLVLQ